MNAQTMSENAQRIEAQTDNSEERTLVELALPLMQHWKLLLITPLLAAGIGFGATYVVEPTFTAQTTLLPPEKPQSGSSAALQSLGALAGLAGVSGGKTTTDQFAALLQSVTIEDRLIEQFKLLQVYEKDFKVEARRELEKRVRINIGKKDGLLTIEVDDKDPQRAAAMANQHVEELRKLTSTLAVTEAQQRRAFFETQLKDTQAKLTQAQQALQGSGISAGALKTEPKAAADSYAKLRAEVTSAQVRLQTLRGSMTDSAVEVRQQQAQLSALQGQLAALEKSSGESAPSSDYVSKYREFKYQETLMELMARQYELARVDESREGALIQVVDVATPPEKRSKPKRLFFTAGAGGAMLVLLLLFVYVRDNWRRAMTAPASVAALARLRRG
jgi:uncharacterized protein involved in exopolysaccharide biosynthesis